MGSNVDKEVQFSNTKQSRDYTRKFGLTVMKDCEWLFCPSDVMRFLSTNSDTLPLNYAMMRKCPFSSENACDIFLKCTQNLNDMNEPFKNGFIKNTKSNTSLIRIEENTNIIYFHFGDQTIGHINCYIETPPYKWPTNYTFLIWVKWEGKCTIITAFEAGSNAPIFGIKKETDGYLLGCASAASGATYTKHTKLVLDEWQFIVAVGGIFIGDVIQASTNIKQKRKTNYFCGSLSEEPTFSETVDNDTCGFYTNTIGNNSNQGPGKVAYIKILKCHLSHEQILDEYYSSMNEIYGKFWCRKEFEKIVVILMKELCSGSADIIQIIINYCCLKQSFDHKTLYSYLF